MKIVVIGGTGLIGSKLITLLRASGHEAVAASPTTGVNTITGEGLAQALAGAQVVVDVANSPSFEDAAVLAFFETSGRHLLAAEAEAGVAHHVALSVVGTERLQGSGYFRGKLAQENFIRASRIPYTLVHATQFFEFMRGIVQSATGADGQSVRVSSALMQPMSSDDVAAFMADATLATPVNGITEIAGPERVRLSDLAQRHLTTLGDARQVIADAEAPYFGTPINDQSLVPADGAKLGSVRFDDWLKQQRKSA